MISLDNLTVSYGGWTLFDNISLLINPKDRIGLVGKNGAGKTTLLRLIVGEQQPTSGSISYNGECTIGYLPQQMRVADTTTLVEETAKAFDEVLKLEAEIARLTREIAERTDYEPSDYESLPHRLNEATDHYHILGGDTREADIEKTLLGLGFKRSDFQRATSEFSGGWRMRIELAKLLLRRPSIFLLDEPTNHLDVTTIEWLEGYLKSYPKAVVVVSHDRMFLDNVVDVVYEIEYGTARRYPGNYTNFIARKKENYDKQMKDHIAQQKEIERLQRMVTRFKGKPTKTSMAQSKQKAIDRMVIIEAPDKYDNKTFHANFQPEKETGNDVLYTSELAIGYDHPLSVVSLDLKRGEKLGILGGNGLGKSTFLKTIVGKIPALSGEYRFGTNVQIGYFDQQMAMYTSNKTVLDDFWDEYPNLTETEARNALGAFLFSGDDVFKNVNMLSGGEKVRLALCKILKTRPNVLVLDEPTNHMDIVGKETLESMLKDYKGTLIFVSHDRYFVKKVATQLLVFEDGTTNLYQFGYEQYQEKLDREASESKNVYRGNAIFGGAISQNGSSQTGSDANRSTSQNAAAGNVGESTNANSAAQAGGMAVSSTGKAYYNPGKERSKIQKKVKKAEEDLAVKEAKLDELKAELMKPEYQSSYSKLTEIQNEIDALEEEILIDMEAWEELSSQLEALG